MPLPCSPVSNSTASESQSQPTSDDSDESLTTPRPGPADPAQRTISNLSRPSVPPFSTSPEPIRSREKTSTSLTVRRDSLGTAEASGKAPVSWKQGPSPSRILLGEEASKERQKSVTFLPDTSQPKHSSESSYVSPNNMMATSGSPAMSPHGAMRNRLPRDSDEIADSSADESTAIMRKHSPVKMGYGAVSGDQHGIQQQQGRVNGHDGTLDAPSRRKSGSVKSLKGSRNANASAQSQEATRPELEDEHEQEGWFRSLVDKYGSVELENKGSVARDHLALERTFLAWLRTSLSFASIGIAITQLFRLNTSIASSGSDPAETTVPIAATARLRSVGKPLGATFLGISILILLLGFHRYFESQHYVIRGKFPASRGTIIIVSAVATALIVASLVVVIAVAPEAFEKR